MLAPMRTTGTVPGPVPLAYERAGAGPLVVFLHGIGGNRTNWAAQLDTLADQFCAVAGDARGYGDSGDGPEPLRFGDFADDVVRLLDHLGAERAHLVGLSMGGMIAQDVAARHAERLATLTLVDSSSGFGGVRAEARDEFLARRLEPLERGLTPADIAPALVEVLVSGGASAAVKEQVRASVGALRKGPYIQALHAIVTTDFRSALGGIAVPTLVVVGEEDKVTPPANSHELASAVPGAELVTIPGAGHLSNLDQPQAFDAALRPFLDPPRRPGHGPPATGRLTPRVSRFVEAAARSQSGPRPDDLALGRRRPPDEGPRGRRPPDNRRSAVAVGGGLAPGPVRPGLAPCAWCGPASPPSSCGPDGRGWCPG